MEAVGIILEANPFHNGHKYLIEEGKKLFPNATFIAITSTSFTMRGEISILDKFTKTKILLEQGFDIVLELPISFTLQSADYFSLASIKILNKMQVRTILAGSENSNLNLYDKIYKLSKTKEFDEKFKSNLTKKNSYKITFSNTLSDLKVSFEELENFNKPNATLAFQYYKVIKDLNLPINLHLIKRTNNYYQKEPNQTNIASASYIRENINNYQEIAELIPYEPHFINLTEAEKIIMELIKYQTMTYPLSNPFININGNIEGLDHYIMKNGNFESTYQTLLDSLKNKKYSTSRIRRLLISLLIKLQAINSNDTDYLRILGLNNVGTKYINKFSKTIKNELFSSPNELTTQNIHLNYEILTTKLYGIITNNQYLYKNEYKLPIKKEA